MIFLNPGFLYLLPLSSLPLIFHLLGKKRLKKLPFPWVRLIKSHSDTFRFHNRLIYPLILLIRILVIMLPILVLSRPRIGIITKIDQVLIDASYSMSPYKEKIQETLKKIQQTFPHAQISYFTNEIHKSQPPYYSFQDYQVLNEIEKKTLIITDLGSNGFTRDFKGFGENHLILDPELFPKFSNSGILGWSVTPGFIVGEKTEIQLNLKLFNREGFPVRRNLILEDGETFSREIFLQDKGESEITFNLRVKNSPIKIKLLPEDEYPGDDYVEIHLGVAKEVNVAVFGSPTLPVKVLLSSENLNKIFKIRVFNYNHDHGLKSGFEAYIFLVPTTYNFSVFDFINFLPDSPLILIFDKELKEFKGDVLLRKGDKPLVVKKGRTYIFLVNPDPKEKLMYDRELVLTFYDILFKHLGIAKNLSCYVGEEVGINVEDDAILLCPDRTVFNLSKGEFRFIPRIKGAYFLLDKSLKDTLTVLNCYIHPSELIAHPVSDLGSRVKLVKLEDICGHRDILDKVFLFLALSLFLLEWALVRLLRL